MMADSAKVSTDGQSVEAQVAARTAAGKEKRQILQKLTQIGGVQRYKDELRQALAGT